MLIFLEASFRFLVLLAAYGISLSCSPGRLWHINELSEVKF